MSESKDDEYSSDEYSKEEDDDDDDDEVEGKLDDTVSEELSSPIRPFVM